MLKFPIFTEEAAADDEGPLSEFLTLFCRLFSEIPGIVIGENQNVFFKMLPLSEHENKYFTLGQLCALAIINIGRGPECLNTTVVKFLYQQAYTKDEIKHDNGELNDLLCRVENGETEILLDMEIPSSMMNDLEPCKQLLVHSFLIKRHAAAIEQFGRGLGNVVADLISPRNYFFMKTFLTKRESKKMTLSEFRSMISFENPHEAGSNEHALIIDLIYDTEEYFADIANGVVDGKNENGKVGKFRLEDLFFLFTGMDRVPAFGLPQKIKIQFGDIIKISTCGLTVSLPLKDMKQFFDISMKSVR